MIRDKLLLKKIGDDPENAAQQQTQDQTRNDRELVLCMVFLDVDVARQLAREGNLVEEHQHTPHNNHLNTGYIKCLA